ncbi:hypothetical protein [Streptomyces sp. NBC_01180]|uniref:hypothetical protein n=1 Tax=Streptomyces sp. NBC_01180 TaxID=2903763 RepID=UPI00386A94EC|nr:hypothetical protein OG708_17680 [Streptomyces sp. NBC_01180]
MAYAPDAVAVASLDTHRLIITVPNGDPIAPEIASNLPRASVAAILRALADQLDPEEAAPSVDLFTESAIRRSALLAGAATIEALPQDYECDPGRGDAVKLLRRLAHHHTTAEQPTGLTWEARAQHATQLYATTAIERDDARTEAANLRAERAELIRQRDRITNDTMAALAVSEQPLTAEQHAQGQADADALAAELPDTVESLLAVIADDIPDRRARAIAADYLARYTRLLVAEARERHSQRNAEMRTEGYRGRVAWCSGMREVAALLDARADQLDTQQP